MNWSSLCFLLTIMLLYMPLKNITSTCATQRLGIHGSFVIAAICRDGIIVASESRGNIFDTRDKDRKPMAYYDVIQKVFPIGNKAIAETNQGLIAGRFFSSIVADFP